MNEWGSWPTRSAFPRRSAASSPPVARAARSGSASKVAFTRSPSRRRTSGRSLSSREPCLKRVDWDATIAYRRYLWSWAWAGRGDGTAQRGMGLDWQLARAHQAHHRGIP